MFETAASNEERYTRIRVARIGGPISYSQIYMDFLFPQIQRGITSTNLYYIQTNVYTACVRIV